MLLAAVATSALTSWRAVAADPATSTASVLTRQGLEDFRDARPAEALVDWQRAADAGDAEAALFVGVAFDAGEGVPQDQHSAMAWYERAARAGSAAGAFNLGVIYDSGRIVPRDAAAAAYWYSVAASRGFPRSQYNLALLYEDGDGVPRERAAAIRLFRAAARAGLAAAQSHLEQLGEPYVGLSVPSTDVSLAEFRMAQQALLGRSPADTARAAVLLQHAAAANNPMAEYDLGFCYENGVGLAVDKAQARAWYQRAAQSASQPALRKLAEAAAARLAPDQAGTSRATGTS